MTITIDKKFFIKLGIVLALCVACFFLGRCSRSVNVSSKLEDELTNLDDMTQELYDDLINAGFSIESAKHHSEKMQQMLSSMSDSMKDAQKMADNAEKMAAENQKIIDELIEIYNKAAEDGLNALDKMVDKVEILEKKAALCDKLLEKLKEETSE